MFNKIQQAFNIEILTHSFKTVIACIIGLILTTFFTNHSPWIVISIIVVMIAQIYVGGVLLKAYYRFLGTLLGCIIGISALKFFGSSTLVVICTISLSVFIFSYLAIYAEKLYYIGILGAVTTIIIMLGNPPTIQIGIHRLIEITIGIFVASLVSQFILPIHAKDHLLRAQAKTLSLLQRLYHILIVEPDTPLEYYAALDEEIVLSISKQRQLANESKREKLKEKFDQIRFLKILSLERDISRSITFLYKAKLKLNLSNQFYASPQMNSFNKNILDMLAILEKATHKKKRDLVFVLPDTSQLASVFAHTSYYEMMSDQTQSYIDAWFFTLNNLIKDLDELAKIYGIL